jgi:hypothetical protein
MLTCVSNGEGAVELVSAEIDAALFGQFAECGIDEIGVGWFAAAAREGPMAGPGVAFALGPAHEENGFDWGGGVHNRDGRIGLHEFRLARVGRRISGGGRL